MKTKVTWIKKNQLKGETETGHRIYMDSVPAGEKSIGPTPKEMVLQGLAGCTMMDVAVILRKQRKNIQKFWIEAKAELAPNHPKIFTNVYIGYKFMSNDLNEETARKAIDLSINKYCAVYNMLSKSTNITYTLEIQKISE